MLRKLLVSAVLVAGSVTANAGPVLLSEGFDDFTTLDDWYVNELSTPCAAGPCGISWFAGNTGIFGAASGAADSYIAANPFNAGVDSGGNIDTWLITSLVHSTVGGLSFEFATRSNGEFPDNLEVYYNNTTADDVGSLGNLANWISLGNIGAYPTDWTSFNYLYSGGEADVRFAFRYTVTDTLSNGDYIGIDSISVSSSVPEPATWALMAMGMLLTPLALRRRRTQI